VASILLTKRAMFKIVVALLGIVLIPGIAFGQAADRDLARAAARHQKVSVFDAEGFETTGRLLRVDADSITIQTADGERSFDLLRNVQGVYRRGDSVKSGAQIGGVAGGLFGLWLARNMSCGPLLAPHKPCSALHTLGLMGYMGGIGAGIGVGIDALHRSSTRIYPSLSAHHAGAVISTTW
jgi:hypothetical protein